MQLLTLLLAKRFIVGLTPKLKLPVGPSRVEHWRIFGNLRKLRHG